MIRNDVFVSKYLKAGDLNGKSIIVTIEHAPLETLKNPEGKEQAKTVLYFKGGKKVLPLNMINWDACAAICGDDTDDWPGHQIELFRTKTQMGGKVVDAIRVRRPQAQQPKAPKPPPAEDMGGDEIPF